MLYCTAGQNLRMLSLPFHQKDLDYIQNYKRLKLLRNRFYSEYGAWISIFFKAGFIFKKLKLVKTAIKNKIYYGTF